MANPPELSRSVVPPGGYIYDQALADGSTQRITGASYDHILELVLKFRQTCTMLLPQGVGVSPESVWGDYNAQVCAKYPWNCSAARTQPQATSEVATGATGFEMLIDRLQRWIKGIQSQSNVFVDYANAQARAQICMACPQNVFWQTNCGTCNQTVSQQSAAIRGGHRTGMDEALKACRAFGTLQELAVWLAEPGGEAKYQPPPICWRLTKP